MPLRTQDDGQGIFSTRSSFTMSCGLKWRLVVHNFSAVPSTLLFSATVAEPSLLLKVAGCTVFAGVPHRAVVQQTSCGPSEPSAFKETREALPRLTTRASNAHGRHPQLAGNPVASAEVPQRQATSLAHQSGSPSQGSVFSFRGVRAPSGHISLDLRALSAPVFSLTAGRHPLRLALDHGVVQWTQKRLRIAIPSVCKRDTEGFVIQQRYFVVIIVVIIGGIVVQKRLRIAIPSVCERDTEGFVIQKRHCLCSLQVVLPLGSF